MAPVGAEFQVNAIHATVPARAGDRRRMAMETSSSSGPGEQRRLRMATSSASVSALPASRVAVEFQINSHTSEQQNRPAVAAAADGRFVVAWQSFVPGRRSDRRLRAPFLDRRHSSGGRVPGQHRTPLDEQAAPAVAADGRRRFRHRLGERQSGRLRTAASSPGASTPPASALGVEFQVNTYTHGRAVRSAAVARTPTAISSSHGTSYYQDGNYAGVFARRFDSAGSPQATEFQVNSFYRRLRGRASHRPRR